MDHKQPPFKAIDGNRQLLVDELIISIFESDDDKRKTLSDRLNYRANNQLNLIDSKPAHASV